jgi:hypothetical protein
MYFVVTNKPDSKVFNNSILKDTCIKIQIILKYKEIIKGK